MNNLKTIIFKPTYSCNVRCKHCNVGDKKSLGKKVTPEEVVHYLSRFLAFLDYIGEECNAIDLVWHGGEPMTMGPDFYRKVNELLQRNFPHITFIHGMQTNLLLYSSSWKDVFSNIFCGRIGTSYDFFSTIRPYSEETFLKVFKKYQDDLSSSSVVICILSKENEPYVEEIIEKSKNHGFWVKLNKLYIIGDAEKNNLTGFQLTLQEYFKCLKRAVEYYLKCGYPFYPYAYFLEDRQSFQRIRCDFGGLCIDSVFYINPFGDLYKCAVAEEYNLFKFGNLLKDDLNQIVYKYSKLKAITYLLPGDCLSCDISTLCGGGCLILRWLYNKTFTRKSPYCEITKYMVSGLRPS